MKAYCYSAIFNRRDEENNRIENTYGTIVAINPEDVKKEVLKLDLTMKFIMEGYALKCFACQLIDPEIAPMNLENKCRDGVERSNE